MHPLGPCHEWPGPYLRSGYGQRRYKGTTWRAHRAAWDEQVGPIPTGQWVLHRCDNRRCVRISHLYIGDREQNTRDAIDRDRVARGVRLPQHRLLPEQVLTIRRRYAAGGVSQRALASEYGVCQEAIRKVIHRINWRLVEETTV